MHSALLELLTPLEVQSVLGHELGHLKVRHLDSAADSLWLSIRTRKIRAYFPAGRGALRIQKTKMNATLQCENGVWLHASALATSAAKNQ